MAVRNDTILAALYSERDRIQEILNADRKPLEATLTAVQHMIAIYEARATESVKDRLPATLKAAKKIRNENGNGTRPIGRPPKAKLTQAQQRNANMLVVLSDPDNANRRGMAPYINSGYLTRDKQGNYVLTPRGKQRLSELTDASTP